MLLLQIAAGQQLVVGLISVVAIKPAVVAEPVAFESTVVVLWQLVLASPEINSYC